MRMGGTRRLLSAGDADWRKIGRLFLRTAPNGIVGLAEQEAASSGRLADSLNPLICMPKGGCDAVRKETAWKRAQTFSGPTLAEWDTACRWIAAMRSDGLLAQNVSVAAF